MLLLISYYILDTHICLLYFPYDIIDASINNLTLLVLFSAVLEKTMYMPLPF